MFGLIKEKLHKAYEAVTKKLGRLFASHTVDEAWLEELKKILISADAGPQITTRVLKEMHAAMESSALSGQQAHDVLVQSLQSMLPPVATNHQPVVLLVVGVNGSGKTTFIGKLAATYAKEQKKTLIIAGDTFRAAATEQLASWADNANATLHEGRPGQEPASVIFDGCALFESGSFDRLIIDTAGRLQSKTNLMHELAKIRRIVEKKLPQAELATWLVLDSMLGQNSIAQAKQFNEATHLSGLVLTKCDGTSKAGFVLAIAHELKVPIAYITFGEKPDALAPFDGKRFIEELLAP